MTDFVKKICEKGKVYIVGGAPRNISYNLLHNDKIKINDRDILVTGIELDELKKLLMQCGSIKEVGQRFGVIKFKSNSKVTDKEIDIALPRTEISTGPGYKDFKIVIDSELKLIDDFKRRDATINTLAIQIYNEEDLYREDYKLSDIIDLFGGLDDLKHKLWRAVGNAEMRFLEDPTRIMRAIRQCGQMMLNLEKETYLSIKQNYNLLKIIISESVVRITEELVILVSLFDNKMCIESAKNMVEILFSFGIMDLIEIPNKSLNYILKCNNENSNLRIRMGIILFASENENLEKWIIKYELSAAPHFPKKDVMFIKSIGDKEIKYLLRDLFEKKEEKDSDILMRKLLQKMDNLSPNYGVEFTYDMIRYYSITFGKSCKQLIELYENNKNIILKDSQLKLDGNTIIELYGLRGVKIKKLKSLLFDAVTDGKVINNKEKLIEFINDNAIIIF